MTDTITVDVVNGTIAHLRTTVERAQQRLVDEEREYNAKRDRMVEVAHRRGTANGIGPALDDLLEEFDLPRRQPQGDIRMIVRVSGAFNNGGSSVRLNSGQMIYPPDSSMLVWPMSVDWHSMKRAEDVCMCANSAEHARAWLTSYYGAAIVADWTFQIADERTRCTLSTCPNSERNWPTVGNTTDYPWHTSPTHVFPAQETPAS